MNRYLCVFCASIQVWPILQSSNISTPIVSTAKGHKHSCTMYSTCMWTHEYEDREMTLPPDKPTMLHMDEIDRLVVALEFGLDTNCPGYGSILCFFMCIQGMDGWLFHSTPLDQTLRLGTNANKRDREICTHWASLLFFLSFSLTLSPFVSCSLSQ